MELRICVVTLAFMSKKSTFDLFEWFFAKIRSDAIR